jgi:hypothetical protein
MMPTATLAVQSTVDRRLLGVATSATQFIRSIGSTVGTAVVGSLVTSGCSRDLRADAPQQAPDRLVSALENVQALVRRGPATPSPGPSLGSLVESGPWTVFSAPPAGPSPGQSTQVSS